MLDRQPFLRDPLLQREVSLDLFEVIDHLLHSVGRFIGLVGVLQLVVDFVEAFLRTGRRVGGLMQLQSLQFAFGLRQLLTQFLLLLSQLFELFSTPGRIGLARRLLRLLHQVGLFLAERLELLLRLLDLFDEQLDIVGRFAFELPFQISQVFQRLLLCL